MLKQNAIGENLCPLRERPMMRWKRVVEKDAERGGTGLEGFETEMPNKSKSYRVYLPAENTSLGHGRVVTDGGGVCAAGGDVVRAFTSCGFCNGKQIKLINKQKFHRHR